MMLCPHAFGVAAGLCLITWSDCNFFVFVFRFFWFLLQIQSYHKVRSVHLFRHGSICCQIKAYFLLIWSEPEHLSVTHCLPLPSSAPCLTQQKASGITLTNTNSKWLSIFRLINCTVLIITHYNILYHFMFILMNITHCC